MKTIKMKCPADRCDGTAISEIDVIEVTNCETCGYSRARTIPKEEKQETTHNLVNIYQDI
jgi:Zn ribbon nucleic-acid-binding protein